MALIIVIIIFGTISSKGKLLLPYSNNQHLDGGKSLKVIILALLLIMATDQ
jgi:hypothetical protein